MTCDGGWDFFGFWLALGSLSSLCFPVTTGGEGFVGFKLQKADLKIKARCYQKRKSWGRMRRSY